MQLLNADDPIPAQEVQNRVHSNMHICNPDLDEICIMLYLVTIIARAQWRAVIAFWLEVEECSGSISCVDYSRTSNAYTNLIWNCPLHWTSVVRCLYWKTFYFNLQNKNVKAINQLKLKNRKNIFRTKIVETFITQNLNTPFFMISSDGSNKPCRWWVRYSYP